MHSSRVALLFALSLFTVASLNAAAAKGVIIEPGGNALSGVRVAAYALESAEAQTLRYESDKP